MVAETSMGLYVEHLEWFVNLDQEGNNPLPLTTGEYVSRLTRGDIAEGACLLSRKVLPPQMAWGERILHKLILTVVSDIFIPH